MTHEATTTRSPEGFFEPFAVDAVPWDGYAQGSRFASRAKPLGAFGGGSHVGVLLEELEPGKQACPNHYHMLEEEHVYLLAGELDLRLGPRTYRLKAGDYVCFPAGQQAGHSISNPGEVVARYILVGERHPAEVVVYPDTGRIGVALMREGYRQSASMPYWEGQEGA